MLICQNRLKSVIVIQCWNTEGLNVAPCTILKLWEIVERIINYVYLFHLGKNSEKKIFRKIKYSYFLLHFHTKWDIDLKLARSVMVMQIACSPSNRDFLVLNVNKKFINYISLSKTLHNYPMTNLSSDGAVRFLK